MTSRRWCVFAMTLIAAVMAACGNKRPGGGGGGGSDPGRVEAAFTRAAKASGIPVRYLMAVGYLESQLTPTYAYARYESDMAEDEEIRRGTFLTETAFGRTFEELGLDPDAAESRELETQIEAYAAWAKPFFSGFNLSSTNVEDKYYWIKNLAKTHRGGNDSRKFVQVRFAEELINVLNEGFSWQDPRDGRLLRLAPEKPPISRDDFPPQAGQWFNLGPSVPADVTMADLVDIRADSGNQDANPKRVRITHCPLELSACLDLQARQQESDVYLGAHYLVHNPLGAYGGRIIQIARHHSPVVLTNHKGAPEMIRDSVVIMLVGNSGRIVAGIREPADPMWFSSVQLESMGQLVGAVCRNLFTTVEPLDARQEAVKTCMEVNDETGVRFYHRDGSEEFRWGQIADFERTIFSAYIDNPGGLGSGVAFEFKQNKRRFSRKSKVPITLRIEPDVDRIKLERLERCPGSGKVVWTILATEETVNERTQTFAKRIVDAGPNRNGEQFLRAHVYSDNQLVGWAVDKVMISDFVDEERYADPGECR